MQATKAISILLVSIICGIAAHPFSTFVLTITDQNGRENPIFSANQVSTIYFKFSDLRNNLAPVSQNQLLLHHARWLHIQFASLDRTLIWHVHPDDFYDVSQMGNNGTFWVQATFPNAGFYSMAADFIFNGVNARREGVASNYLQVVNGTQLSNTTATDFSNTTYAATWPFGMNDQYLSPIDSRTNVVSSSLGIKVVLEILQNVSITPHTMTGMHMRSATAPMGNTAVVGKCSFFKISVYWNDGTPVTTMRPYLNAAVHFSIMSEDGGLFHAHGSYLPDGMTPNEVSGMLAGMQGDMSSHNMTDEMMNLTMNAMMSGLFANGSLNCLSDAGTVMDDMDAMGMQMDHNEFYGPENFGPSFFGIFDWNTGGLWRMWAWMKINVNGEDRLLVPQFDVTAVFEDQHTTMHMSSMDMGSASSAYPLFFLVALIAIFVL